MSKPSLIVDSARFVDQRAGNQVALTIGKGELASWAPANISILYTTKKVTDAGKMQMVSFGEAAEGDVLLSGLPSSTDLLSVQLQYTAADGSMLYSDRVDAAPVRPLQVPIIASVASQEEKLTPAMQAPIDPLATKIIFTLVNRDTKAFSHHEFAADASDLGITVPNDIFFEVSCQFKNDRGLSLFSNTTVAQATNFPGPPRVGDGSYRIGGANFQLVVRWQHPADFDEWKDDTSTGCGMFMDLYTPGGVKVKSFSKAWNAANSASDQASFAVTASDGIQGGVLYTYKIWYENDFSVAAGASHTDRQLVGTEETWGQPGQFEMVHSSNKPDAKAAISVTKPTYLGGSSPSSPSDQPNSKFSRLVLYARKSDGATATDVKIQAIDSAGNLILAEANPLIISSQSQYDAVAELQLNTATAYSDLKLTSRVENGGGAESALFELSSVKTIGPQPSLGDMIASQQQSRNLGDDVLDSNGAVVGKAGEKINMAWSLKSIPTNLVLENVTLKFIRDYQEQSESVAGTFVLSASEGSSTNSKVFDNLPNGVQLVSELSCTFKDEFGASYVSDSTYSSKSGQGALPILCGTPLKRAPTPAPTELDSSLSWDITSLKPSGPERGAAVTKMKFYMYKKNSTGLNGGWDVVINGETLSPIPDSYTRAAINGGEYQLRVIAVNEFTIGSNISEQGAVGSPKGMPDLSVVMSGKSLIISGKGNGRDVLAIKALALDGNTSSGEQNWQEIPGAQITQTGDLRAYSQTITYALSHSIQKYVAIVSTSHSEGQPDTIDTLVAQNFSA